MKKTLTALALVLALSACEPVGQINRWSAEVDPYMVAAGWTMVRDTETNRIYVRLNGVDIWSEPMACFRFCTSAYHVPNELRGDAIRKFIDDLKAARASYVQSVSEKTGLTPRK